MHTKYLMKQLSKAYLKYVVCYHGVSQTIVSDRDMRYLSHFWESQQMAIRTKLLHNTSLHPTINGQTERTNETLEDMLHVVFMELPGSWNKNLELVEFSYNNSYQTNIHMVQLEAL